jgi:hypothetical protein
MFGSFPYSLRNLQKRLIPVWPLHYWLTVARGGKELSKWSVVPIAGPKDDGNDNGGFRLMTLESTPHFNVVTIVRCDEIGTDKQQDDIVAIDVLVDRLTKILACANTPIVPSLDDPLPFQHCKLRFELVAQSFVGV